MMSPLRNRTAAQSFACVKNGRRYCRSMRRLRFYIWLGAVLLVSIGSATAATGKVVKVLPHLLDLQGRHMLSPSLYDRDAYQAELRKHPEKCSGIRFDIQWRGRSQRGESAVLRLQVRGTAKNQAPPELQMETTVKLTGISHWAALKLVGEPYQELGEVTAWRVTLWAGDELLGEQKSFLW